MPKCRRLCRHFDFSFFSNLKPFNAYWFYGRISLNLFKFKIYSCCGFLRDCHQTFPKGLTTIALAPSFRRCSHSEHPGVAAPFRSNLDIEMSDFATPSKSWGHWHIFVPPSTILKIHKKCVLVINKQKIHKTR